MSVCLSVQVSLRSLTIAHCDAITVEGMESLTGLRSLVHLDLSGCKVKLRVGMYTTALIAFILQEKITWFGVK